MKTEIILYRQNLVANPRFAAQTNYGWELANPSTWGGANYVADERTSGYLAHIPIGVGVASQSGLFINGATYRLKITVLNRSAGTVTAKNDSSGATIITISADGVYEQDFVADGTDLILTASATFNGKISNVSVTELPEYFSLDLDENVSIPFNFNIDNIFKLNERKANYTKTISLPGTHNNNRAFNHIYKANVESSFDPTKKTRVVVKNSGILVFEGVLCLDNIVKTLRNGIENIKYEVSLLGESYSIFDRLNQLSIADLDFSRWNHEFSYANLANLLLGYSVWDNIAGAPLSCVTTLYTGPTASAIVSGTYNGNACVRINFSGTHSFTAGDCLQIESDNPYLAGTQKVGVVSSSTSIVLTMAYANLTTTSFSTLTVKKVQWESFGYWYPFVDHGRYVETLNPGAELINGATYTFAEYSGVGENWSVICIDPLSSSFVSGGVTGPVVSPAKGVTFIASDGSNPIGSAVNPLSYTWDSAILQKYSTKSQGGKLTDKRYTSNLWAAGDLIPYIYLREIWYKMFEVINYRFDCPLIDGDLFRRMVMPLDSKFDVEDKVYDENISPASYANFVEMNNYLPNMKLSDFFVSVLNMFNLVILEDKEDKSLIKLVSRNDFYNGNITEFDLDASEPLSCRMASSLVPNYYTVKFKKGSDFYNVDYLKDFGSVNSTTGIANQVELSYGDLYFPTYNEINKDSSDVQIKVEPTVMVGNLTGLYEDYNGTFGQDKVISATYTADENGLNVSRKSAIRYSIAGYRGTQYPVCFNGLLDMRNAGQAPGFGFDLFNAFGSRLYPYANHIDNIFDAVPYYDINFDVIQGRYFPNQAFGSWNVEDWQSRTLYGLNWKRFINEVSNRNIRSVSGRFRISISNVYNLNFQDTFKVADFMCRLTKVVDWDLNGDGLCTVEFLLKKV